MMKKSILIILVLSLIACSKHKITVSGIIHNADTLSLFLDEVDVYDSKPIDSVNVKQAGKFRFTIHTSDPGFYQLRLSNNKIIVLFPNPGQHIQIEADADNFIASMQIEGSDETEQVLKVVRNLNKTRIKLDSLNLLFKQTEADSTKQRLNQEYNDLIKDHRMFSITFLLTHYKSFASLYVLYQQFQPDLYVFHKITDLQYYKIISDSLKKYYPDNRHVIALEATTQRLIGDYNELLIMRHAENIESTLPEVALPNVAGDTININSLNKRYILLYFWASWNQESMDQNPQLVRVYNSFKNKGFEVLAVSFDNSTDSWTRAINYDELYWINVIDNKYPNSLVAANYNVTSLPFNYLIDKEQLKILGKNLTPAQLQVKLSELFN